MAQIIVNVRSTQKDPMNLVIDSESCKGCGFCIEYCPKKALAFAPGSVNALGYPTVQVTHPDDCRACGLCELYCPDFAIHLRPRVGDPIPTPSS